jgi:hypothetical protein
MLTVAIVLKTKLTEAVFGISSSEETVTRDLASDA